MTDEQAIVAAWDPNIGPSEAFGVRRTDTMHRLFDIAGRPEDFRGRVYHSPEPTAMTYAEAEAEVLVRATEPCGWSPPNDANWRELTNALELTGKLETRFYTVIRTELDGSRRIYVDLCRWHTVGSPVTPDVAAMYGRTSVLLAIGRGIDHDRAEKARAALLQSVWRTPSEAPDYPAKVEAVRAFDRAEYDRCNPMLSDLGRRGQ